MDRRFICQKIDVVTKVPDEFCELDKVVIRYGIDFEGIIRFHIIGKIRV